MIENAHPSLKAKALSKIVKGLILSSKNAEIFRLRQILIESGKPLEKRIMVLSKREIKEDIKKRIKTRFKKSEKSQKDIFDESIFEMQESRPVKKMDAAIVPLSRKIPESTGKNRGISLPRRVLRIPESQLPERLRHIRPIASGKKIDLGKLNPLVEDSNVATIETAGESEKVFVTGNMGRKPTNMTLSKHEISEVINRFSQEAKIPKHEGLFKAVVGNLLLTAVVSESVSSRFVIKKIGRNRPAHPSVPRP